jgi:hypothetical protein
MKHHRGVGLASAIILLSCKVIAQQPVTSTELPTVATTSLLGTGLLSKPLYIKHLKSTNSENIVMFYDVSKVERHVDPQGMGILCAQVVVKDELVRIAIVDKQTVVLTPKLMELEKAVVMATTWAAAKGVRLDAYTVSASHVEKGGIDVFFEYDWTRYGGHFGVYVRSNLVVFGQGK